MEIKYDNHEQDFIKCISDKKRIKIANTWMNDKSLGNWRMDNMHKVLKPFINKKNTWLTIGDGRYGTDANYIISNGGDAFATDMSDKLLKIASEKGFINKYRQENAEFLSFEDDSFDYVLIKEALHHCPRAWVALHEAFRVCRKAVLLIEPNDKFQYLTGNLSIKLKNLIKKITGYKRIFQEGYWFEDVGNFGYTINKRELEKFLLGMHFQNIAFIDINDHYIPGVEFCPANGGTLKNWLLQRKIKNYIFARDILCKLGIYQGGLIGAALYKESPNKKEIIKIKKAGWRYKNLPKNPYI